MKSSSWKAGAARVVITPSEAMWLGGWAARREPAADKSMDLFARALALEDADGRRVIILTVELIAIARDLAGAVGARIKARHGLKREGLLISASHTHCGPEVRPDKAPFFEIPPEFAAKIPGYLSTLQEKMCGVADAALERLEPASLQVSRTSAGFARNRRSAGGPVTHEVPVLQVSRTDKKPLAIVFGYACHNLTLPPSFCQYHGDYAGVAQSMLEETFPGATALFLVGAGADQDPEPRGSLPLTLEHGQALAQAVKKALGQSGRAIEGSLAAAFEEVPLDFQPLPSQETLEADLQSKDAPLARKARYLLAAKSAHQVSPGTYPCPIQVLRFGKELLLVALGGEPVVDYAARLKAELPGPLVWVAGYCNDMFGYLPSRRVQSEGGYEGGRALLWSALPAPFTDTVEERVISATRRLAAGLEKPYPARA